MTDTVTLSFEKRKWHYLQPPAAFQMAPCSCGNHETQWSEYAKHLWCAVCEKDFIPEHAGVFDGPIAVNIAAMLGVRFDRFNMETNKVERFDLKSSQYLVEGVAPSLLAPCVPPAS
jgi:hypothetical protein